MENRKVPVFSLALIVRAPLKDKVKTVTVFGRVGDTSGRGVYNNREGKGDRIGPVFLHLAAMVSQSLNGEDGSPRETGEKMTEKTGDHV